MKNNLYKYIKYHKKNSPQKTALIYENSIINYQKLSELIDLFESYLLKNLGIKESDRIAILSYNRIEYILLFYACAKIGSIIVPINWRLTNHEISNIISETNPKALFIEKEFEKLSNPFLKIKKLKIVGINFKPISNLTTQKLKKINFKTKNNIKNNINKPLLIIYTSGTTGKPKGAVITQKAIYYNNLNSIHMHKLNKKDIILTVTNPALHNGATVVLLKKFNITQTFTLLKKYQPTYTVFVPTIMELLLKSKNWNPTKFSSLRAITTGSTIVSPDLIKIYENNSIPIIQVYGSTETCPIALCQNILDKRLPYGNVGKSALKTYVNIFDKNKKIIRNLSSGEIGVKGLNLFSYYWKNKISTKKAFHNGWFMTGDFATKNKNNQYFILGRKMDVIISGGENIYPAELERIINQENNIDESAVIGISDSKWQEIPIAFIKLKKNKIFSPKTTIANIKIKLAKYKIPKKLIKIKEIPKNALGKIDYKALKEYYNTLQK